MIRDCKLREAVGIVVGSWDGWLKKKRLVRSETHTPLTSDNKVIEHMLRRTKIVLTVSEAAIARQTLSSVEAQGTVFTQSVAPVPAGWNALYLTIIS